MFLAVIGGCVFSWLTVAQTTDLALITGSSATPLPIIQTPVPISGFYLAAPPILLILYLYLHLYLQRLWEGLVRLPAFFPSGRTLDRQVYPWLLAGLVSAYVPLLREHRPSFWRLQIALSIIGAWALVPFTLVLFWLRYLTLQDWSGTIWQIALLVFCIAMGVTFYQHATSTLRGDQVKGKTKLHDGSRSNWNKILQKVLCYRPNWWLKSITSMGLLLAVGLSFGAIEAPSYRKYPFLHSFYLPYYFLGYSPSANLTETAISSREEGWWKATKEQKESLEGITGANLRDRELRYAHMASAFLAKADLRYANLQMVDLRDADLRGANIEGADLQVAHLQGADLRGADLESIKLRRAYLRFANLIGVNLRVADLPQANLRDTNLRNSDLLGADLQGADLRKANLQDADLQKANLQGADLRGADLQRANLQKSNLEGANLEGANLEGAKFQKAYLKGAELRLAINLTQKQIDLACSDESTKFPKGLMPKTCVKKEKLSDN